LLWGLSRVLEVVWSNGCPVLVRYVLFLSNKANTPTSGGASGFIIVAGLRGGSYSTSIGRTLVVSVVFGGGVTGFDDPSSDER